jgi:hypothetical protein
MKLHFYLFLLALPFCVNAADPMYKSVDEKGNVTYSSEPPSEAIEIKEIDPPTAPTKEQILRTQEQQHNIKRTADGLEQANKKPSKEKPKKEIKEKSEEDQVVEHHTIIYDQGRADQTPKPTPPVSKPKPVRPPVTLPEMPPKK